MEGELVLTEAALVIRRRDWKRAWQEQRIPFTGVRKVVAFKRDCYTVDSIRMLLVTDAGVVEISEEMSGWDAWTAALPDRLSGAKRFEEWFFEVAFPAFEEQATLLYDASSSSGAAGSSRAVK